MAPGLRQGLKRGVPGEQLAYVAALAVGAALVFGDRPKRETWERLLLPSLADLDAAFAWQVSVRFYSGVQVRLYTLL